MCDLTPAEPRTVRRSFGTGVDWNGPHLVRAINFKKMEACNGSR